MNTDILRQAIRLSMEGTRASGGGPFGAVIVRDGQVVGSGHNRVVATNDPTAHAEVVAIRDACANLKTFTLAGCEIYSSSEPCPMCLGAIHWAHLDRIYFAASRADAAGFGFRDDALYREISMPINERMIPTVQALSAEAREVFREWVSVPGRVKF